MINFAKIYTETGSVCRIAERYLSMIYEETFQLMTIYGSRGGTRVDRFSALC